jgi:hypothetical protein
MNNTFKKKGAVEMSLNLIIMLIIGMVVLGLVIGFVNSLVNKGVGQFESQIGENEQLKLDQVKASTDNLAVLPEPRIDVKIGTNTNIFIKARSYGVDINCNPGILNCPNILDIEVYSEDDGVLGDNYLEISGPGFKAKGGAEDSKMYTIKTLDSAVPGIYYLTIYLYKGDPQEESETLTVTVK